MSEAQIYLSPPDAGEAEVNAVVDAIRSGWVAPVGPDLAQFEQEICDFTSSTSAVALASGTAGLHLGMKAVGVNPGDSVICPTSTFGATAFAICHAGATPIFVDSEIESWNLDPNLLAEVLDDRAQKNELPAAILTVDLFGRPCDYDSILPLAERYGIPVIVDAAEALGATHQGQAAGTQGVLGVYSFNGNKIITTSGGGAVVSEDPQITDKIRHWSTQAREDFPWYEHNEVGYNYRMSNILAALGRAQLARLPEIIEKRRQINAWYSEALGDNDQIAVVQDPPWGRSNYWITNIMFDDSTGQTATRVREALAARGIESRPAWKPMHQQPVFANSSTFLNGNSDEIFARGLCVPSGNQLEQSTILQISEIILDTA